MDESNPTARALLCLQLLQDQLGITADRLARGLGCSSRAARRYVAILREAGVPVHSVRGPYGGYRLGSGVRPPPVMFSATEALGLVMAVLDGHHDAGDEIEPVGAAWQGGPRPAGVRGGPGPGNPPHDRPGPGPRRRPADPTTTIALVQASSQDRRVRLRYRSEAGKEWITEADPWARRPARPVVPAVPRRVREVVRAYRLDRCATSKRWTSGSSGPRTWTR